MSGGNPSKKQSRSSARRQEGWEEAGGEFYQESYPGGNNEQEFLENLQRADANKLATLLPSKKVRATTVKRVRNQTERRQSTTARNTVNQDVHLSMLPDLSENLSNEERIWEEIMQIKAMPVPMAQKRDLKAQLQSSTKLRLQGLEQLHWVRRKAWQRTSARWAETLSKLEPWRRSIKIIEGSFGTGVVAYFLFLRWLFFLNLAVSALILLFLVVPKILLVEPEMNTEHCSQEGILSVECCSNAYSIASTQTNPFLDTIQGTGWMERTMLFYGVYTHQIYSYSLFSSSNESSIETGQRLFYYDMPLAYILVPIFYMLMSLMAIVKSASKGFKERLVEGEGQFYMYCNLVFGGWDFCIHNEKSASYKHKALYNELKGLLEDERHKEEKQSRSRNEQFWLAVIRFFVNIFVVFILMCSAYLIYVVFNYHLDQLTNLQTNPTSSVLLDNAEILANTINTTMYRDSSVTDMSEHTTETLILLDEIEANESILSIPRTDALQMIFRINDSEDIFSKNQLRQLLLEYLPSLCIVSLNLIVPQLFEYLVEFESYTPQYVIKISLLRTVFLRLSALAVLLSQIFLLVNGSSDSCYVGDQVNQILCWETYFGQQLYKLLITDFVIQILITFFVNLPRSLIAKHLDGKFVKLFFEQEFSLPKHVLDIVYSQTIIWLGAFFCPFLPIVGSLFYFVIFYIKKFACLVNSTPSQTVYRASRSKSMFMLVLLLSFAISLAPVAYTIAEITPSMGCGPYRGLSAVWDKPIATFESFPKILRDIVFLLGTSAFAVPAFILVILMLYYYWAVTTANRHMVNVLKNQLVLEGHDKQFLLNRLSAFIRQHQKRCERAGRHNRTSFADEESTSARHSSK